MGRTTNIIISTNPRTKTRQTQDVWFGDGEIRLSHECGELIGEYVKDGGYYVAVLIFKDDTSYLRFSVQSVSPPRTTATQAAQAVAWAYLACKALEGFAAAAAKVFANMEWEKRLSIDINGFIKAATEAQAREAAAEGLWQEYRKKGGWHFATASAAAWANPKDNTRAKIFVFNAAENLAFFTTKDGQLLQEKDAEAHFVYVCGRWANCTIAPYVGKIWAYFFRANADSVFDSIGLSFGDFLDVFKAVVPFDELENPEQVYAWLTITEARNYLNIAKDVLKVDFRWKLSYYKYGYNIESKREEQRTIIADCK